MPVGLPEGAENTNTETATTTVDSSKQSVPGSPQSFLWSLWERFKFW